MKQSFGDWRDTSWQLRPRSTEEVTIHEVLVHLSTQEAIDISIEKLTEHVSPGGTPDWDYEPERVAAASLKYPIIIVQWADPQGHIRYILDGNHRFQKAVNEGVKSIKAKILDLDNAETPEMFKKTFLFNGKTVLTQRAVWREYSGGDS